MMRSFFVVLGLICAAGQVEAQARPIKVFISADMEGVVGVVTGDQLGPTGFEYGRFREFMTREVLAAIRGARAGGAGEIVVADAHGNGENLLIELELRLDNVVHRMGFAPSRQAARQLARHRHVQVNGRTVDIPSYRLNPGDEVRVAPASRELASVQSSLAALSRAAPVSWIAVDTEKATGKITERPTRGAIPVAAQEQLIVELYSK